MAKITDPGRITSNPNVGGEAFTVRLRDNKPLTIKAATSWEAVEKYKRRCGIIATDNQFDVQPADDVDALDVPLRDNTLPPLTGFNDVLPRPQFVKGVEDLGTLGV